MGLFLSSGRFWFLPVLWIDDTFALTINLCQTQPGDRAVHFGDRQQCHHDDRCRRHSDFCDPRIGKRRRDVLPRQQPHLRAVRRQRRCGARLDERRCRDAVGSRSRLKPCDAVHLGKGWVGEGELQGVAGAEGAQETGQALVSAACPTAIRHVQVHPIGIVASMDDRYRSGNSRSPRCQSRKTTRLRSPAARRRSDFGSLRRVASPCTEWLFALVARG